MKVTSAEKKPWDSTELLPDFLDDRVADVFIEIEDKDLTSSVPAPEIQELTSEASMDSSMDKSSSKKMEMVPSVPNLTPPFIVEEVLLEK